MKKITLFIIILILNLNIVNSGIEFTLKPNTPSFNPEDQSTWLHSGNRDWNTIGENDLKNADPNIVSRATQFQAQSYFYNKIPPPRSLNANEWILWKKLHPGIHESLDNIGGLKVSTDKKKSKGLYYLQKPFIEFPDGRRVYISGNINSDIRITSEGLKVGAAYLTKGAVEMDPAGKPIFKKGSQFKFKSMKNDNWVEVVNVPSSIVYGSCSKISTSSCIEELQDKRRNRDGAWVPTVELKVVSRKGDIHIKMPDNTYDDINVHKGILASHDKINIGGVKFTIKKKEGGEAVVEFPANKKTVIQNGRGLKTNFHTEYIGEDGNLHTYDLIEEDGELKSYIDSKKYGSWSNVNEKKVRALIEDLKKTLGTDNDKRKKLLDAFVSEEPHEILSESDLDALLGIFEDEESQQLLISVFKGKIESGNKLKLIMDKLKNPSLKLKVFNSAERNAKLHYSRNLAFTLNRLHDREMVSGGDLRLAHIKTIPSEILYIVIAQGEESYDSTFEAVHNELKKKLGVNNQGLFEAFSSRLDPKGDLIGDVIGTYARYGFLKDIIPTDDLRRKKMIDQVNNNLFSSEGYNLRTRGGELSRALAVFMANPDARDFTGLQLLQSYEQSKLDGNSELRSMYAAIIAENMDSFSTTQLPQVKSILSENPYIQQYKKIPPVFTDESKPLVAVYYFHPGQEGYLSGIVDAYQGKSKVWQGDGYADFAYAKTIKGYASDVPDGRDATAPGKTVTMIKDVDGRKVIVVLTSSIDKLRQMTKSKEPSIYGYAGHSITRSTFWNEVQTVKKQGRPVIFYDGGCGGAKTAVAEVDQNTFPISNLKTGKGQTNRIVFYYLLEKMAQGQHKDWSSFKTAMSAHAKKDVGDMQFPGDPELGVLRNFDLGKSYIRQNPQTAPLP